VPCEATIRTTLRPLAVQIASGADDGIGVVDEFWVPATNARADMAVISSELYGYEIKSAADTLRRLPRQIDAFGRIFDRCFAVVAERHLERAFDLIPDWWGVIAVEDAGDLPRLVPRRDGAPNPCVDLSLVVRLLWRDEVADALRAHGTEPNLRAGRAGMWKQLLACADASSIAAAVRSALRARTGWESQRGLARLNVAPAPAR
jgi:hypothetical protein